MINYKNIIKLKINRLFNRIKMLPTMSNIFDSQKYQLKVPWLLTLDNVFVDVTVELPNNKFLIEYEVQPGTSITAMNEKLKNTAEKVLKMAG